MFRRTFWFTAGAAAGVWATAKVNAKIRRLSPESLAAQAANKAVEAGHRIKDFALDVRDGMAEREAELDEALGRHQPAPPELPTQRRFAALERGRTTVYTTAIEPPQHPMTPQHPNNRNEDH